MNDNKIVGITGPSEVGKTTLLRSTLTPLALAEPARAIARVDLDAVYSPRHLMRRWLRAIAQGAAGPVAFSHIAAGTEARALWPSATRRADHLVRDLLQDDYAVAFQGDREAKPSKGGEQHIARALAATARLADQRPTTLVIDHLESPELSGALDVRNLLWQIRALSQRSALRVVLACRQSAVDLAADVNAAFYGDGTWLTIEPPKLETWREIATRAPGIERIYELTGGHVWSTVLVLARMDSFKRADDAFDDAALEHQPLAARCVRRAEHAAPARSAGLYRHRQRPRAISSDPRRSEQGHRRGSHATRPRRPGVASAPADLADRQPARHAGAAARR